MVSDRRVGLQGPWDELFVAVHGFRMPVFFLLSGFFTAMLWRRHGLASLIRHRFRRVVLPLALSILTVGPAMQLVVTLAQGSGKGSLTVDQLVPEIGEFYHMWFLWMLMWMLTGFLLVTFVVDQIKSKTPQSASRVNQIWPRWVMWILIPLTLVPQFGMADRGSYPMFGPDTHTGLLPPFHLLAYYAAFFTFGALSYGRYDRHGILLANKFGKRWLIILPLTLMVVLPVGLAVTFVPELSFRLASQIMQVLYAWGMCLGLIGLFRFLLVRERRGVRYLADASYWIYLTHLPLVIGAQIVVRDWHLPSGVKFLLITIGVSTILLISYQTFIRYTPIGTLLNGRKSRPL